MKIITSRRDRHTFKFPVGMQRRSVSVVFDNHQAFVTDSIAEQIKLLDPHGAFYSIKTDYTDLIGNGKRILIIRDTGLGDVLLCTPLLRFLSNQGCIVDFATCKDWVSLFKGNTFVKKVYELDAHGNVVFGSAVPEYSVKIDLRLVVENAEAQQTFDHRVVAFGKELDTTLTDLTLDIFLTTREKDWGKRLLKPYTKPIAYALSASCENRSWPNFKHRQVLQSLVKNGYTPLLISNSKNAQFDDIEGIRNFTGDLSVREVAQVLHASKALLTPDTGIMHMGAAVDCPTVCYWGAFPMTERAAFRPGVKFRDLTNRKNCARVPCRSYSCWNHQRESMGFSPCLDIPLNEIMEAVDAVQSNGDIFS